MCIRDRGQLLRGQGRRAGIPGVVFHHQFDFLTVEMCIRDRESNSDANFVILGFCGAALLCGIFITVFLRCV